MSWTDKLSKGIGDAVSDIRSKTEEAIWGRETTGQEQASPQQQPEQDGPALGSTTTQKDIRQPENDRAFGGEYGKGQDGPSQHEQNRKGPEDRNERGIGM